MKKIIYLFSLALFFLGCTTVVPEYVPDNNPYQKNIYASYAKTLDVTRQTLEQFGWKVIKEADPAVYERVDEEIKDRILLITAPRSIHYGLGSHQARLNVRLTAGKGNTTDVEIRYVSANKVTFKQLSGYKKDGVAEPILDRIAAILK